MAEEKKEAPVVPCDHIELELKLAEEDKPNKNGDTIQRLKEVARMTARPYQEPFFIHHKSGKMIPHEKARATGKSTQLIPADGPMKGDKLQLYASDGACLGEVVYEGDGRFVVQDDPMDIKIGKEFWFLAGQFDGDPTVAHGKVVFYQFWHSAEFVKPRCKLTMELENGVRTPCYDTDLHPTRESAEKARALQLEEEQG